MKKTAAINIRVDEFMAQWLKEQSTNQERSVGALIRLLIKKAMEEK